MSREYDCRALAAAMPGWDVRTYSEGSYFNVGRVGDTNMVRASFPIPAPDAPIPEHLEFVGRIAEALGYEYLAIGQDRDDDWSLAGWRVEIDNGTGEAPDLAHAAMRAALAAKGAT